jgi:ELWxxDGT repeat protein
MRKLCSALCAMFICSVVFSQNPQMLKDVFPGNNSGTIQQIVKTGNYVFFNEDDDDADTYPSLFRTDGTNAGTVKLNLTYPGYISSKAEMLTPLGNKVVFAGDNFTNYGEIWSSDGTQAGTVAIERFQPINNRIPVVEIKTMGSYSYYSVIDKSAGDNLNHAYLRRTDGTAGSASLVYDFSAFTGVPQVVFLTPVNNILYFIVYDAEGTGVDQLWRSDGTTAGTYMVYNFTTANFVESFIMPAGNTLYLMIGSVVGGVRQNTIWKSDGTSAGTVPVKLIGTGNNNIYPPFAAIGNTLYFAGVDGNGKELWQTDGTAAGTYMVADINPGAGSSNPAAFAVLNSTLFFAAITPTNGGELWKYSSGVASLVKDINPGSNGSGPGQLTVSGNTILFNANNGTNGGELWITDGTAKNTVMIADINPGPGNSVPNTFTPGNPVYFAANNGTNGFEVYKYDNNGDVLSGPQKYYVNDNSQAGDVFTTGIGNNNNNGSKQYPFATIDYAFTQVQAGDSILVDAGTYVTANISINKAITILGPNYNISPLDATRMEYNNVRNAEAFVTGSSFTIGASDIIIKGLVFDPGAKIQISKGNNGLAFSNITISKNGFLITSNLGAVNIFGNNADPAAGTNYNIEDNAFVQQGTSIVQTVTINAVNGLSVSNNSFLTDEGAPFTQTAIHLGANALVDNISISGNVIVEPFTGIFSNFIGSITVDNNKFLRCFNSTAIRDANAASNTITVKNNYYQINRSNDALVVQLLGPTNVGTVKRVFVENNTMDINATGFISSPTGYLYAQCNVGVVAAEYQGRKNTINITGNLTGYSGLFYSMRCNGKFNSVNIDNNEIYFNATNLPATSNAYGIVVNLNTGGTNFPPPGSSINITQNKVSGFGRAVQFLGGVLTGVTCNINENSLINNRDLAIVNANQISPAMNATCNWYGFTDAQSIAAKIFSSTPGAVTYSPWLINGTDNEPSTPGFQPVPGSCSGTTPTVTLNSKTDVSCNGGNNGTINITPSGGTTPYSFAWTKDGDAGFSSSNEDLTNLTIGTYRLTVTDQNGSTAAFSTTITEPPLLTASADGTNVSCYGGSNGTATVTADGGTTPYSYLWSNNATTQSIGNLSAGTYTVTVTDGNGCTKTSSYQVTQPATQLSVSMSTTSASCNGSATATPAGGTSPYTYLWSNNATTQSITNVPAGAYTVTVTDANGCTIQGSVTIVGNSTINPKASVVNVSCYGLSNGSVTVTSAGGTPPLTYNINGGAFQASPAFNNLPAGTYVVGVKDANGCSDFVTKIVTQPALLTVVTNSVQNACYGQNNGAITITASGGNGAYTYSWTGPNGFTSTLRNISGLAIGNYAVVVKDANNCTTGLNAAIANYDPINVVPTITHVFCNGDATGTISLAVSGGTGSGFTYVWTAAGGYTANTKDIAGLLSKTYTVTVTDIGSGCKVTNSYLVSQPTALTLTASRTNATDCNLGSITALAGNGSGTPPYQYKLDNGNYQSSGIFTGLYAGTYTVWVKDANGCTKSTALTVSDNGSDEYESNNNKNKAAVISVGTTVYGRIALATDPADWFKFTTGVAGTYYVTLTHPSASFVFDVYPSGNGAALTPTGSTTTSKTYTMAANTTYTISISGGLSYVCYQLSVTTTPVTMSSGNMIVREVSATENKKFNVSAFPNPTGSYFNLKVETASDEKMSLRIMDISGRVIEERQNILPQEIVRIGARYFSGVYMAEIRQGQNKKVIKLVKL